MLDASNSDQSISSDDLIKKYDMVQKLFVMDTQIYWTRSQLLLVANSALAGFALNSVPINSDAHTVKIWTLFIEAIIGILLCVLWRRAIKSGSGWMNHWKTILIKWKSQYFPMKISTENARRPYRVPAVLHRSRRFCSWFYGVLLGYTVCYVYISDSTDAHYHRHSDAMYPTLQSQYDSSAVDHEPQETKPAHPAP